MIQDRLLSALTAILLFTGLGTIGYVFYSSYFLRDKAAKVPKDASCVQDAPIHVVRDHFMTGLVEKGQQIRVYKDYYKCNDVVRDDLVYFRISAPIEPVVKIVKGLPGDKYAVTQDSDNPQNWRIKINDQPLVIAGKEYTIQSKATPALRTYEISRKGVLRDDEYLVFSAISPGQSDSGSLGIVRGRSLEGKVIPR